MGLFGPVCQSCTMPLSKNTDQGTEKDGSLSEDYCRYCYQSGKFTDPKITADQMTRKVKDQLVQMKFPGFLAGFFAGKVHSLKRWKSPRP